MCRAKRLGGMWLLLRILVFRCIMSQTVSGDVAGGAPLLEICNLD